MGGAPRREPLLRWSAIERDLRRTGVARIAGVDEVGRGSLAGPVIACAVIMPGDARTVPGVDDSKRLTALARSRLARRILARALAVGVGGASAREIDRVNIYHATVLAMRRALVRLSVRPEHVLIDGRPVRTLGLPHTGVIHGDDRCFNIACASIVAKVTRDRLMTRLARRYPDYGWGHNCGYATPDHVAGLLTCGVTPHHRRSFLLKAFARQEASMVRGDATVRGVEATHADAASMAAEVVADLETVLEFPQDHDLAPPAHFTGEAAVEAAADEDTGSGEARDGM